MIKRKNIIKIAIDSPAAAGAGTIGKALSKHYNLFYLDTGKIYRFIAFLKLNYPKKFNAKYIKKKINKLQIKDLSNKNLLSDEIGSEASLISKKKIILAIIIKKTNENFCAAPLCKRAERNAIPKSSLLEDICLFR